VTELPPFMSPEQLADYCGVSINTVYRWRKYSQGPVATRMGKHLRFARADVIAWLEGQREQPRNVKAEPGVNRLRLA
jgi:excisionase family DNA binding protein